MTFLRRSSLGGASSSQNSSDRQGVFHHMLPGQRLIREPGKMNTDAYGISDFANSDLTFTVDDAIINQPSLVINSGSYN